MAMRTHTNTVNAETIYPLNGKCQTNNIVYNTDVHNLTNSTEWAIAAKEAVMKTCINQIQMNNTVVVLDENGTYSENDTVVHTPIYDIENSICPYDCNGHGTCDNGTCICDEDFGFGDCSVNITAPPPTQDIYNEGLCDTSETECDEVSLYGEDYLDSEDLSCRVVAFEINSTGGRKEGQTHTVVGEYISRYEVSCPVPPVGNGTNAPFVPAYKISISNTGDLFGDELDLFVYNSDCVTETDGSFSITDKCCYIERQYYSIEEINEKNNSQICDPARSTSAWSDKLGRFILFCQPWQYGFNCQQPCQCMKDNAIGCDEDTGVCECKQGWNSSKCETDIDECLADSCPSDAKCTNYDGFYNCSCGIGRYIQNQTCVGCEDNYYGQDCQRECQCVNTNTKSCSKDDGKCTCNSGWEGAACDEDIVECTSNLCQGNATCSDADGSYTCTCNAGYVTDNEQCIECAAEKYGTNCNETCECDMDHTTTCDNVDGQCTCQAGWTGTLCHSDINECEALSCQANADCKNNNGSYTCECKKGYKLTGVECLECDDDKYGTNCNETCECDVDHTTTCDKVDGQCTCQAGWTGTFCRNDINECEALSCQANADCKNNNGSYTCVCKKGYKLADIECIECEDYKYGINCSETCQCTMDHTETCDKVGGYCTCSGGWMGTLCDEDINECDDSPCPNNSICENTDGSHTCTCNDGFKMANNICQECDDDQYGKNCNETCECDMDHTAKCDKVDGQCTCQTGWTGTFCRNDMDECKTLSCQANADCKNNNGSYTCECKKGYKLTGVECLECEDYKYGINCSETCQCTMDQTETCDKVSGYCTCSDGWMGTLCEEDINECDENPCPNNSICENTDGSHTCTCNDGFKMTNSICQDINECDNSPCPNSTCENTDGSYTCACNDVFKMANSIYCNDTCECDMDHTTKCDNVDGQCTCQAGWTGTFCRNDFDECEALPCQANADCKNNNGSYTCECKKGYVLTDVECLECDDDKYGTNCNETCECDMDQTTKCDNVDGQCTCKAGWTGTFCRNDINECEALLCQENADCKNNNGSYTCECKKGYKLTGVECLDINECDDNPCPNSICENTDGSHTCTCNDGFKMANSICQSKTYGKQCEPDKYGTNCSETCQCAMDHTVTCDKVSGYCTCSDGWMGTLCEEDINECDENPCPNNSICENTDGSHTCTCNDGFKMTNSICQDCNDTCECDMDHTTKCDNVDGQCTCQAGWTGTFCRNDFDECEALPCQANADCKNNNGSYTCECKKGYVLTDVECLDINEYDNSPCPNNNTCENNDGSHTCTCNDGLKWRKTCTCECDMDQTTKCDNVDGQCTCKAGWTGTFCRNDINECEALLCQENADCKNNNGSYTCECKKGYKLTGVECLECEPDEYGSNCSETCQCAMDHTETCDKVSGHCTCSGGWTGTLCEEDINECDDNPCPNSICENTDGSHTCTCNDGFKMANSICQRYEAFEITMKLDVNEPDWSNKEHMHLAVLQKAKDSLTQFYTRTSAGDFLGLEITGVRRGSLNIDHIVYWRKGDLAASEVMATIATALEEPKAMLYDAENVGVISVSTVNDKKEKVTLTRDDLDTCNMFTALEQCPDGEACEKSVDGSFECVPDRVEDGLGLTALVLVIVIPVVFLVVIVFLVVLKFARSGTAGVDGSREPRMTVHRNDYFPNIKPMRHDVDSFRGSFDGFRDPFGGYDNKPFESRRNSNGHEEYLYRGSVHSEYSYAADIPDYFNDMKNGKKSVFCWKFLKVWVAEGNKFCGNAGCSTEDEALADLRTCPMKEINNVMCLSK
ncbi:hypothetical protein ScPMuIL_008993 [Solemya velum]